MIPDLLVSAACSSLMFVFRPWVNSSHSKIFLIAYLGILVIYFMFAAYYYKKIVLHLDDWGRD